MKGYCQKMADGKLADCSPCRFCLYEQELTVGPHCYNCITTIDLAMHKPNAETEFVCFKAKTEDAFTELKRLQEGDFV